MFFFVTGGKTEALFEYALACAAKFAGVKIIGWCLMSNHYHILVYDPHGTLAMFLHHLPNVNYISPSTTITFPHLSG